MNRQEKQLVIDSLKKSFSENSGSFLVGIKGMTVEELRTLRKGVVSQGGQLQVIKNTLMKVAVKDMPGLSDLTPYFKDQIALVFASKEVPAVAKVLCGYSENNEKLTVVAGCLDLKLWLKVACKYWQHYHPREVLLAQVCGNMKAPINKFVSVLNIQIVRMLLVLNQIAEKKSKNN